MKIGVITQHRVFNYGSALQAYATQVAVEKVGYKAEIIDYYSEQRTIFRQFCELPKEYKLFSLKGMLYILMRFPGNLKKEYVFKKFLKKNVSLSSKKYFSHLDLVKNPPEMDIYMTGSDQVWNSDYNEGIDPSYYLDFGDKNKRRISYAASIGMDYIPFEEQEVIKNLLSKYYAITVRETSAKNVLEEIGVKNVEAVLDPTMLLLQEDWEKIEKRPKIKDYILVMILYGEECDIPNIVEKIHEETGLQVIELVWNPLKKRPWKTIYGCSPEEFLGYIHNAKYVVTNSFHVTTFSINYKKEFLVVKRKKYNSRIESLLKQLKISDRYIESSQFDKKIVNSNIPYEIVNVQLDILRNKSFERLRSMIED